MNIRDALIDCLPAEPAVLVGRAWLTDGPAVVTVRDGALFDISRRFATVSDLLNQRHPADALLEALPGAPAVSLAEVLGNSPCLDGAGNAPVLLAPCDLQAIKACGVTFTVSLMERLIEERAGGDPERADSLRAELLHGIGPDAEVFTKAQPLSAVGHGMEVGIHPDSRWNNPEPEVVLAVNRDGRIVGATLGNDVNLRDVEGRSALLLGLAKDNNGACAIGPFIRLFHGEFTLDAVRRCTVTLQVRGPDGFAMEAQSHMARISRDPDELVCQVVNRHHAFPDGLMLFVGTMFAPTTDRDAPGLGFAHRVGDIVAISTPVLGRLVNRVNHTDRVPAWTFGITDFMRNLASRGLL